MQLSRILILSNNAFSMTNSNGRTLMSFFDKKQTNQIAQFFIKKGVPDFSICTNFFFVSDIDVVNSFFCHKKVGQQITHSTQMIDSAKMVNNCSARKIARNPLTMLIRQFFWKRQGWRKNFFLWIDQFHPDCVLLQAGDSPFMYDLAVEVACEKHIPLLIYNSESYYFKNYNYLKGSYVTGFLYPLFRWILCKSIHASIEYAQYSIYISDELKAKYDKIFHRPSIAIYTSTEVVKQDSEVIQNEFSYLGNLGLQRYKSLIEIANALQKINKKFYLDVYGKVPNQSVQQDFEHCKGIRYHGFVSYEKVKDIIAHTRILVHAESFAPFYVKDIQDGFSTKIPDSLASGRCFLIYAPLSLACTRYIMQNKCGCVITDPRNLYNSLNKIIYSPDLQREYIKNALQLVNKNHNQKKNIIKFNNILNGMSQ